MPVRAEYELNLSDYRKAAYYGLAQRYRTGFRMMIVLLTAFVIYLLTVLILRTEIMPIVFFVVGAYVIWALVLMAGTETRIRRYMKDPETVLGKHTVMTIDRNMVEVEIPDRKIHNKVPVSKLAYAFELTDLFMIYLNTQDTYILPKRAIKEEEVVTVRNLFLKTIPEHFISRFLKKKKTR